MDAKCASKVHYMHKLCSSLENVDFKNNEKHEFAIQFTYKENVGFFGVEKVKFYTLKSHELEMILVEVGDRWFKPSRKLQNLKIPRTHNSSTEHQESLKECFVSHPLKLDRQIPL